MEKVRVKGGGLRAQFELLRICVRVTLRRSACVVLFLFTSSRFSESL